MQIISTNIAKPDFVTIKGKQQRTGIFKKPVNKHIFLGKSDVKGDEVTDRKHHGGEFKACYMFSADNYPYWESLYPNLDWHYGMIGENLTVKGLDETKILIGNIYKVGNALIQITQPREPCNTFAAKIGSTDILKQFIAHGKPGTYIRVLEEGFVQTGDEFKLIKKAKNSLTSAQLYNLIFTKEKDQKLLELAIQNDALPIKKREKLKRYLI